MKKLPWELQRESVYFEPILVMAGSNWGFSFEIYILLGLYWATWGVCAALQKIFGQLDAYMYVGLILARYLGPSAHIGSFQGYVGPIWGHMQVYSATWTIMLRSWLAKAISSQIY